MSDLEIRRDDLRGARRSGTIRWWKDDEGYGRLTADDGEVLWFHFSGLVHDGFKTAKEGDRVSFVWNGRIVAHQRHVAEDVRFDEDTSGPAI